jgi:hypothetical protein
MASYVLSSISDSLAQQFLIRSGWLDNACETGEGHNSDLHIGILAIDERKDSSLGCLQAVRGYVC